MRPGKLKLFGATGSAQAEAATARAAAFVTVTTVGNVKKNRLPVLS